MIDVINPGIGLLEVPEAFRQRDFFNDAQLHGRLADQFSRSNGRSIEPSELDWLTFAASMPFTANALVASAALTDSSQPYALGVTPVESVKLSGIEIQVKKEHAQKTGSAVVRGYLYAGLYQRNPNQSLLVSCGSKYQLEAVAYTVGHLGMRGLVYVPSDFEMPELDTDLLDLLTVVREGDRFQNLEAALSKHDGPTVKPAKEELTVHPITGFYINTGKRSVVGETVVQVEDAAHVYFPQDNALSGQGVHVAREAYGNRVRVSSVRIAPFRTNGDYFEDLVEARMARGALESVTRIHDHEAVQTETATPAQAAQGMIEYAEATGDLIGLAGGATIAAVMNDAPDLKGKVVAIVEDGNITEEQFERTIKGVASLY